MLKHTLATMRRLFGLPGQGFAFAEHDGAGRPPRTTLIYRLRAWPLLPDADRTADIYRVLSVMSSRPLNRQWMLSNSRLAAPQLDALLQRLVDAGAVEVIDPARFAGRQARRA